MSYIQENLSANEKILFKASVSGAIFIPAFVYLAIASASLVYCLSFATQHTTNTGIIAGIILIVSLAFLLLAILFALKALIIILTTEFGVTNKRVIAKTGFIRRRTIEMLLSKVESVSVNQNILGRIFNFGNVTITGTGGTRETFRAIVEPLAVRKKVNIIIERYMQAYAEYQQQRMTSTPK